MPKPSAFIAIEGSDGSGKGTHVQLLADWLKQQKIEHEVFDFPRYGHPSAYFVEKYLNGGYGSATDIGPEAGSLFYALDRYDAADHIRHALASGTVILCNRYVASNMAHQGAKILDQAERRRFFQWNDQLEFGFLKLPRPDLNLVLHMPAGVAQKFVDQKSPRDYVKNSHRDLHEADLSHLEKAAATYAEICELFPKQFVPIDCALGGHIRSIDDIQTELRRHIEPLIGLKP